MNEEHVGTESTSNHLSFSAFEQMLRKAAAENDDPDQDLILWLTERCDAEPKLGRAVCALVDSILGDVERVAKRARRA